MLTKEKYQEVSRREHEEARTNPKNYLFSKELRRHRIGKVEEKPGYEKYEWRSGFLEKLMQKASRFSRTQYIARKIKKDLAGLSSECHGMFKHQLNQTKLQSLSNRELSYRYTQVQNQEDMLFILDNNINEYDLLKDKIGKYQNELMVIETLIKNAKQILENEMKKRDEGGEYNEI